ncbi:Holliday junction resolvase RuvX [Campylobacter canadensis]|uniref:Holliday junction resolvase RuvX n=1 Tax=Campylobacter canadensis TaxID=449520 RepID=A0ABS7WRW5_9BACT|nr:Holliday junction resolvase RuvX [Campylobacter canadensis]MBZ7986694.1 Holliday junction resolvase RuvX [Campylobacter canadensis]MBZ7994612.1 Holliday junction resolvase RuvX [Campylobacter canadensis]MBZ7996828.1 Holliday junction resolvase RuvX [Campylobacter canadensis]MBZ7997730.1 Holliday junction resolvase RuvX [Campylobacter canadensis]MBZ7999943.1 Holliday junction resolvase RuvX [Campylobacter canadensis]
MNILAIDLGLKRIGIALCLNGICMPKEAVLRKNRTQAANQIKEIINTYKIQKVVIGVAMGYSSFDEMQKRAKHFATLLEFENIVFHDESFTSFNASKIINSKKKDGKQDSIAAFLMLKDYLNE